MTSFRVRPRFRRESTQSPQEISERIISEVKQTQSPFTVSLVPGMHQHVVLKIHPSERHYWSPQLSLTFESQENGHTLIRGLYGPAPSVWTLFTFGYAVISVLGFFAFALGFSQWSLGIPAPILWALPVLLVCASVMYVLAQLGQKMGASQTYRLHHFFENMLHENIKIE